MGVVNFAQISVTALKFLLDKDEEENSESESEVSHHYPVHNALLHIS